MEIYTIGFAKKTAPEFFGILRRVGIKRLIDVRLNNQSQLAGFTRKSDLPFFLRELCDADYVHLALLAPTKEILDAYRKNKGSWQEYTDSYLQLLADRKAEEHFDYDLLSVPAVLLCSEASADRCHRRLAAEYLMQYRSDMKIVHL
ncbi:MAG: DUF488 family protein [Limnochordia bacterium]|jgi:uncharacterized protein (DUF488 family)